MNMQKIKNYFALAAGIGLTALATSCSTPKFTVESKQVPVYDTITEVTNSPIDPDCCDGIYVHDLSIDEQKEAFLNVMPAHFAPNLVGVDYFNLTENLDSLNNLKDFNREIGMRFMFNDKVSKQTGLELSKRSVDPCATETETKIDTTYKTVNDTTWLEVDKPFFIGPSGEYRFNDAGNEIAAGLIAGKYLTNNFAVALRGLMPVSSSFDPTSTSNTGKEVVFDPMMYKRYETNFTIDDAVSQKFSPSVDLILKYDLGNVSLQAGAGFMNSTLDRAIEYNEDITDIYYNSTNEYFGKENETPIGPLNQKQTIDAKYLRLNGGIGLDLEKWGFSLNGGIAMPMDKSVSFDGGQFENNTTFDAKTFDLENISTVGVDIYFKF